MGFNCLKARATSRRQFTLPNQSVKSAKISSRKVTGNIVICSNCHVEIAYMHGHFCICHLTGNIVLSITAVLRFTNPICTVNFACGT